MRFWGISLPAVALFFRDPLFEEYTVWMLALAPTADRSSARSKPRARASSTGTSSRGAEYLRATVPFDLEGRLTDIGCPTALTAAEDDPLARSAEQVYDALPGTKVLLRFATTEGAGDHCEMRNRSLLGQRVFDWLDEVLGG
jgi:pimeloyl-ACP methyl ester carboxylesterase